MDTPIVREIRAIHQQVAEEKGGRIERHEVNVFRGMSLEQLDAEINLLQAKRVK